MFTDSIVKETLYNVLNCHKEDIFKYVYLNDETVESLAKNYLFEEPNRKFTISYDDLRTYLANKILSIGYQHTEDKLFINPGIFSNKEVFLHVFNDWSKNNFTNGKTFLDVNAHATNIIILELLTKIFEKDFNESLLERLSLDLQTIVLSNNYKEFKTHYEFYTLSLLTCCHKWSIFSNILKIVKDDNFKRDIFDIVSSSNYRDTLSLEAVRELGANNVPESILEDFLINADPKSIDIDSFISILNTLPLTKFTSQEQTSDSATKEDNIFYRYLTLLEHFLQIKVVPAELIDKIKDAASPFTNRGCTLLKLLSEASNIFLNLKDAQLNTAIPSGAAFQTNSTFDEMKFGMIESMNIASQGEEFIRGYDAKEENIEIVENFTENPLNDIQEEFVENIPVMANIPDISDIPNTPEGPTFDTGCINNTIDISRRFGDTEYVTHGHNIY